MPGSAAPGSLIPVMDQSPQDLASLADPGALSGSGQAGESVGNDSLEEWAHMVRQDLLTIIWWIQANAQTTHLTGLGGLSIPLPGVADFYATPNLSEAVNGANYYQIQGSRNGQKEASQLIDTSKVALVAYKEIYLGRFTVGQGDFMQPVLTATGAPAITLLPTNFAVRCELTQR